MFGMMNTEPLVCLKDASSLCPRRLRWQHAFSDYGDHPRIKTSAPKLLETSGCLEQYRGIRTVDPVRIHGQEIDNRRTATEMIRAEYDLM